MSQDVSPQSFTSKKGVQTKAKHTLAQCVGSFPLKHNVGKITHVAAEMLVSCRLMKLPRCNVLCMKWRRGGGWDTALVTHSALAFSLSAKRHQPYPQFSWRQLKPGSRIAFYIIGKPKQIHGFHAYYLLTNLLVPVNPADHAVHLQLNKLVWYLMQSPTQKNIHPP